MHTLTIEHLSAKVKADNKEILKDFNLTIKSGEIHAIMGPNGAGKSTLSKVIMGSPNYIITEGEIYFDDKRLNDLTVDERARLGLFLGMQMPLEIEGVSNADFLRTALHEKEKESFKLLPFIKQLEQKVADLKMCPDMIHRAVNQGFSGGERKKNEILQMYLLKPNMILLDEIDSGLDVDSLRIVGQEVMKYQQEHNASLLLITHYKRLLEYIRPDYVHIMVAGTIIESGDVSLVEEIEQNGYEKYQKNSANSLGATELHE